MRNILIDSGLSDPHRDTDDKEECRKSGGTKIVRREKGDAALAIVLTVFPKRLLFVAAATQHGLRMGNEGNDELLHG